MNDTTVVLLVEDQPLLAMMTQAALEEAGYKVVVAPDGFRALEQLEGGLRPLALVTDIRLGRGPSGWELAHVARRNDATLPVIYISGDIGQETDEGAVSGSVMLQKPISPTQLLAALQETRAA